ncbi:murein DD-endopeptidase MepM [bacterium BMS3Abin04]|nr:murein DD-endopeptidase MepM [bacterium BMS3Abin04]
MLIRKYSIVLFLIISLFILSCSSQTETNQTANSIDTVSRFDEFGIQKDSFTITKLTVKRNETLAGILLKYNVAYKTISDIAASAKPKFDVRKIRAGNNYDIYISKDSLEVLKYFIYEKDKVNYVVVSVGDSIQTRIGKKEVKIKQREAKGIINSSLYLTLTEENLNPVLAIKLADVFAWAIDFYTIQKGDRFKVIFNEKFVGNKFVGIGEISAAEFIHVNNKYYAFKFVEDGKTEYFDENGHSMQKKFLKAPLKYRRISSRFSRNRFHPILRRYRPHLGIDYAASIGTPVQAVGDGIVVEMRYKGQAGRFVKIRHNSVYLSGYLHLSRYGKGIKRGAKVVQGQIVGYVGRTGLATGPHLDFRFWKNGTLVNYLIQKFPPSHPVEKKNYADFEKAKNKWTVKLNEIKIDTKNRLQVTTSELTKSK